MFRRSHQELLSSDNDDQIILFVRDGKVRKSVERIFTIWEERSVYPEEVIAQFKAGMNKKEKEREKPKEKEKEATVAKGLFIFNLFSKEVVSNGFLWSLFHSESPLIEIV